MEPHDEKGDAGFQFEEKKIILKQNDHFSDTGFKFEEEKIILK